MIEYTYNITKAGINPSEPKGNLTMKENLTKRIATNRLNILKLMGNKLGDTNFDYLYELADKMAHIMAINTESEDAHTVDSTGKFVPDTCIIVYWGLTPIMSATNIYELTDEERIENINFAIGFLKAMELLDAVRFQ
jgi:hypothetical protein